MNGTKAKSLSFSFEFSCEEKERISVCFSRSSIIVYESYKHRTNYKYIFKIYRFEISLYKMNAENWF